MPNACASCARRASSDRTECRLPQSRRRCSLRRPGSQPRKVVGGPAGEEDDCHRAVRMDRTARSPRRAAAAGQAGLTQARGRHAVNRIPGGIANPATPERGRSPDRFHRKCSPGRPPDPRVPTAALAGDAEERTDLSATRLSVRIAQSTVPLLAPLQDTHLWFGCSPTAREFRLAKLGRIEASERRVGVAHRPPLTGELPNFVRKIMIELQSQLL